MLSVLDIITGQEAQEILGGRGNASLVGDTGSGGGGSGEVWQKKLQFSASCRNNYT